MANTAEARVPEYLVQNLLRDFRRKVRDPETRKRYRELGEAFLARIEREAQEKKD